MPSLIRFASLLFLLISACAVHPRGDLAAFQPAAGGPATEAVAGQPSSPSPEPALDAGAQASRMEPHEAGSAPRAAGIENQSGAPPAADTRDAELAGASAAVATSSGAPELAPPAAAPAAVAPGAEAGRALDGVVGVAVNAQLTEARRRIGRLEKQLTTEVKRRREVEAEMSRLLHETAAGPFERGENVAERHLGERLDRARREIGGLRAALAAERRERDELARSYAALAEQARLAGAAAPISNAELEALQERQQRVLASIRQDLEASQQREVALRQAFEAAALGTDGAPLADAVTSLRSENNALQVRLDEENKRNRDLTAKLQLATRVTDLIFKMQTGNAQRAAIMPRAAR